MKAASPRVIACALALTVGGIACTALTGAADLAVGSRCEGAGCRDDAVDPPRSIAAPDAGASVDGAPDGGRAEDACATCDASACSPPGGSCTTKTDCCGSQECDEHGKCAASCAEAGAAECLTTPCCAGSRCLSFPFPFCVACLPGGAACTEGPGNAPCCRGYQCSGGTCVPGGN